MMLELVSLISTVIDDGLFLHATTHFKLWDGRLEVVLGLKVIIVRSEKLNICDWTLFDNKKKKLVLFMQ